MFVHQGRLTLPSFPQSFKSVVQLCLMKDPKLRPTSYKLLTEQAFFRRVQCARRRLLLLVAGCWLLSLPPHRSPGTTCVCCQAGGPEDLKAGPVAHYKPAVEANDQWFTGS